MITSYPCSYCKQDIRCRVSEDWYEWREDWTVYEIETYPYSGKPSIMYHIQHDENWDTMVCHDCVWGFFGLWKKDVLEMKVDAARLWHEIKHLYYHLRGI